MNAVSVDEGQSGAAVLPAKPKRGRVKCIVWDLDNTLWDGVLLEDSDVKVRDWVVRHIKELDAKGVLHSIASKNDHDTAMAKLEEFGLAEYFLCPQINWNPKSTSVKIVAEVLNLGLDAFAFVDDQDFERDEVGFGTPEVICVDILDLPEAVNRPEFQPRFVTDESARRREMYQGQILRDGLEKDFVGTNEEFLAGLEMAFTIESAKEADLQRAEELTVRTNQLNSTGRTYSYEELDALRGSPDHLVLVASLTDKYGSYGKIGLALVEKGETVWNLRMLLMSCRVMSRGVGMVLLNHIMRLAAQSGANLRADLVETGRNRMMQITYAFAGFREVDRDGATAILEADTGELQPPPAYVRLEVLA
ncbi:FkbH-like protein [Catenulispora sp. GAS73]|uniref:HAD-IIIC family phosphatase n=1 Tax=Catenulispora sp. GAS73 TaxID=3156269 RepID=UPI0035121B54